MTAKEATGVVRRTAPIFAVLCLGVASFSLMQSTIIPIIPRIASHYDTDTATASWVITAYLLSAAVCTPIIGRLGDAVGKHVMLPAALGVLSGGCLIAMVAPNVEVLIVARVVQGVGGGVLPVAFSVIREEFPPHRVVGAVSVLSSLMAVGFAVGLVVAGPIVEGLGYTWLFGLPMLVTAIAATFAFVVIPRSRERAPGRVPIGPALLLAGWLVALLVGVVKAPVWGWGSPRVWTLIGLAAVIGAAWIAVENRVRVPLIDMKLMRLPAVWTANLVGLGVGIAMFSTFAFVAQFYQVDAATGFGFGASVTEAGVMLMPMAATSFLTGFVSAPLSARFGAKTMVVVGCVLACIPMFLIAAVHDTRAVVIAATAVVGIGISFVFACLTGLVVQSVPAHQTGVAGGMNANIRLIGGAVGTAVLTTVVASHTAPDGLPEESGYTASFLIVGGMMVVATVASLLIPGRRKSSPAALDVPATV